MRISDWSSDVCSSDLSAPATPARARARGGGRAGSSRDLLPSRRRGTRRGHLAAQLVEHLVGVADAASLRVLKAALYRSEEHTSELQSLMRISYAVFCLKKKRKIKHVQRLQSLYRHKNYATHYTY